MHNTPQEKREETREIWREEPCQTDSELQIQKTTGTISRQTMGKLATQSRNDTHSNV